MKHFLGIESTAHTLGVSVVSFDSLKGRPSPENTRVKSNELAKFPSTGKGYIPRELADHHAKNFQGVLESALRKASVQARELSAVAYSQGPGIGHCLHVGYVAAKTISEELGVPLVPVNHAVAHVEAARFLTSARDPLVVYVSGGNTQIFARAGKHYHVYGETMDIGLGNFLDNVGRMLELDPPDAVGVMKEALRGKNFVELPYTIKGMNLAFAGILTAIQRLKSLSIPDLCWSAQETVFSMLVEATERCLCHTRNPEVLLCGGNARNKRLQEMLALMSSEQGTRFCVAADEFNGDNAAMIALTGLLMSEYGAFPRTEKPMQRMRVEKQEILW
ncbi:MAG: tRNA (adenosine(37)-N6)-threonylcarbamoyltransferase complex transferase subunit TsaD [Candidatus Micrarchaeia archaeon]